MQRGWLRSIEPGSFGGIESGPRSRRDIIENEVLEDDSMHSQESLLQHSRNSTQVPLQVAGAVLPWRMLIAWPQLKLRSHSD